MSSKEQIKAGIFALSGIIFVLGLIMFLGKDRFLFSSKAKLYIEFDQVQGLGEGSIVSLGGIAIGNVSDLQFDAKKQKMITEIKIDRDSLKDIYEGSVAELKTQGALGDKFIFIQPGVYSEKRIGEGGTISTVQASDLMGIISERGKEAAGVFDIIKNLKEASQQIKDEQRIKNIMANFEQASYNLKSTTVDLKNIVESFKNNEKQKISESVEKIDRILTKIDAGQGTLGALVNDSSLHDQLKTMLGGLDSKSKVKGLIRQSQGSVEK